jgi:hypothetical protein
MKYRPEQSLKATTLPAKRRAQLPPNGAIAPISCNNVLMWQQLNRVAATALPSCATKFLHLTILQKGWL